MKQSVPRGSKKSANQPVIITNNTKFTPKLSERTIRKRKKAKERRLNPGIFSSLSLCGVVCLYISLILTIIIGVGGIVMCAVYFNANTSTQSWKIGGIILGVITCILGVILILLSIFKQTRNKPWRNKNEAALVGNENYYVDDDDQLDNKKEQIQIRETASSPIPNSLNDPSKAIHNDLIYCPNCNRLQPSDHQCMSIVNQPEHISIAIQTEEDAVQKSKSHTIIDRPEKHSTTTETQTNPRSNSTENIIYKRVPIPTAKVIVQQPKTKVMIVRVPKKAGELILQPKATATNEK